MIKYSKRQICLLVIIISVFVAGTLCYDSSIGASLSDKSTKNYYNALEEGLICDGITDDYTEFLNLLTKIGADNVTIEFPVGTYKFSNDLIVGDNINLKMGNGAMLSVDRGNTLTINGGIEAGLQQIFTGDGSVGGNPKITEVYPEWFGAKGDDSTDCSKAFNDAFKFFNVLKVPEGKYLMLNVFTPANSTIRGISKDKSVLGIYTKGAIEYNSVLNFSNDNINVSDLTFDMLVDGKMYGDLNSGYLCSFIRDAENVRLKNIRFQNNGSNCVNLGNSSYLYFDDCEFINVDTGINSGSTPSSVDSFIYINNCTFDGYTTSEPLGFTNSNNIYISNCDARNKELGNGFQFAGCENVFVDKCVFDNLGAGVYVGWDKVTGNFSKHITITNNRFINSKFREINIVENTQNVVIDNNVFKKETSDSTVCVYIVSSSVISIENNKFYNYFDNTIYVMGDDYNVGNILISKNHFYPQGANKTSMLFYLTTLTSQVIIEKNYFYDFGSDTKNIIQLSECTNSEKIIFRDDNYIQGKQKISNDIIGSHMSIKSPLKGGNL